MLKHIIISCTKGKKENTLLYKCKQINKSFKNIKFHWFEDNESGLSTRYNEAINLYKDNFDYIHFVHDDVFIYDDIGVIDFTLTNYNYTISGVAGSSKILIKPPYLWHLMGKDNNHGTVEHGELLSSNIAVFGGKFDKAVILDGVFLSVNTKTINDWKFNENFDFHFYDIASCIDAFNKQLTLGVVPIHIRHETNIYNPMEDECWVKNNKIFEQLYVRKTNS